MAGLDAGDPATLKSTGHSHSDYTQYLKAGSLKGARIGIARDFMGKDAGTDAVGRKRLATLKKLARWSSIPSSIRSTCSRPSSHLQRTGQFRVQGADHRLLKTTSPRYPKSFDELVALANNPKTGYRSPEKAYSLKYTAGLQWT